MTRLQADGLLLLTVIIGAATYLVVNQTLETVPLFTLLAIRFAISLIPLTLLLQKQLKELSLKTFIDCTPGGLLLISTLLVWGWGIGLSDNLGQSAFIVSMDVVFLPLFGWLFLRQYITLRTLAGLALAIVGLAVLKLENGFQPQTSDWLMLCTAAGFSAYILMNSRLVRRHNPWLVTWIQMVISSIVCLILAVSFDDLFSASVFDYPFIVWGQILFFALIATSLRFGLQNLAQKYASPLDVAMIFILEPVLTALMSAYWMGHTLSPQQLYGCVIIFCATVLTKASLWREALAGKTKPLE